MRSVLGWIVLVVCACGADGERRFVELPDEGPGHVDFLVQIAADGRANIENPEDLARGPVELLLDDSAIFQLSVSESEARSLDGLINGVALSRAVLSEGGSCDSTCEGICIEQGTVRFPIPPKTMIRRLEQSAFEEASGVEQEQLRARFEIRVERTPSDCSWRSDWGLEPFAAEAEVLGGARVGAVVPIDENRAVVLGGGYILVVERGATVDLSRACRSQDLFESSILSVAVHTASADSLRLWIASGTLRDTEVDHGGVQELLVDDSGCQVIRTVHETGRLSEVIALEGGGFVAVGSEGRVLTSTDGVSVREASLGAGIALTHVAYDPVLESFFVGGGLGLVGEGDLLSDPPRVEFTNLQRSGTGIVDSSVRYYAFNGSPPDHEVWAATYGQGIYRRNGRGDWMPGDLEAPPGVTGCSTALDDCGRMRVSLNLEFFGFGASGDLFVAPTNCSTFFVRTGELPCTGYLPLGGVPMLVDSAIRTIHEQGDTLIIAQDASLWLARAPSN